MDQEEALAEYRRLAALIQKMWTNSKLLYILLDQQTEWIRNYVDRELYLRHFKFVA